MTTLEGITLTIAVVGAALGLINTWKEYDRDRVKLRVTATAAFPVFARRVSEEPWLGIEVINRSGFPVTIREVGFELDGTDARAVLSNPITLDGTKLPLRMEPRTSASFYAEPATWRADKFLAYTRPFARTADGEVSRGSGGQFNKFRKNLRS